MWKRNNEGGTRAEFRGVGYFAAMQFYPLPNNRQPQTSSAYIVNVDGAVEHVEQMGLIHFGDTYPLILDTDNGLVFSTVDH